MHVLPGSETVGCQGLPKVQPSLWCKLQRCQAVTLAGPGSSSGGHKLMFWTSGRVGEGEGYVLLDALMALALSAHTLRVQLGVCGVDARERSQLGWDTPRRYPGWYSLKYC